MYECVMVKKKKKMMYFLENWLAQSGTLNAPFYNTDFHMLEAKLGYFGTVPGMF